MTTVSPMPVGAPIEPLDPGLLEACGDDPTAVCEWVWDRTTNETLAKLADWFIGKPLTVVVILGVAFVLSRIVRHFVRKAVYRVVVTDREAAGRALQRINPAAEPSVPAAEDPRRTARAKSISAVVASTISVIIWVMAVFVALGELSIDLAPLIAGAGIAGVALGFGAQSLVKDCLSGLFMLIEDQFGIGDIVDVGEASGVVERVTLRATVLRGLDGTVWHVPNGEIVRVGNRSQLWSVAVVDVVVAYDADIERAGRILEQTAQRIVEQGDHAGHVLEAPVFLGVESAASEGVLLRLTVKTTPGAQFELQRALLLAIKGAFDEAGIPRPPPQQLWTRQQPP